MMRAKFDAVCAAHPGAALSGQGRLDDWTAGGWMFARFGHTAIRARNSDHTVLRCAHHERARRLIGNGAAGKSACVRGAWMRLDLSVLDADQARQRVAISYATIRAGFMKKAQSAPPPMPEDH